MDQKSSGRSLAPSRIFQTQTVFDLSGNVLSSGPLASTTGKMIDPDIKPIYTDEMLVGYATPLAGAYSLDVFFMSRDDAQLHRGRAVAPERHGARQRTVRRRQSAVRRVRGVPDRRTPGAPTARSRSMCGAGLPDGWMSDISYTWSRFEGNFDLDYSLVAVFNTSSFIQDGPGTNVEDPNRFGPLFEDRPHVFKVFTSYAATSRLTASGYLRVQSGTPWAARGRDWAGAVLNYLEPAGSHRNPTWANLDLMAAYRLPLQRPRERLARSAAAERVQQPDAAVDRRAAVSRSANHAGAAVLRALPAAEPVLRSRQRLRAAAAPLRRRGGQFLAQAVRPTVTAAG